MRKISSLILAITLSCSWAFAQSEDAINGLGAGNQLPPYDVTIKAYAPPAQCNGTRWVETATAKVRFYYKNGDQGHTSQAYPMVHSPADNSFEFEYTWPSIDPGYIEFQVDGYSGGLKIQSASWMVPAAPGGTAITVQSHEWNNKGLGGSLFKSPICGI